MKSFDTELKKYTDKVQLKASERNALRERLLSYMEYHPLPMGMQTSTPAHAMIASESFTVLRFTRRTAQIAAGFFALTLVVLPFAAERSVPGEVLYLVKTGINETVQAQFAASPYEKIEFETKLVERRIGEARALASEGKLTNEVQNQLTETVKTHTKNVTDQIAALSTEDADGAAIAQIAYNSSLEVQTAVLHAEGGEDAESPIGTMLTAVTEARDAALSDEQEQKPSYDALLARVEGEANRAIQLSETIKQSATPDEVRDIDRRLSDIDRLVLEVKAAHDVNAVMTSEEQVVAAGVSKKLIATLRLTQKLIAFMTDIDIRTAITLDTLVPVVLSDDERIANAQETLTATAERILHITEVLPEVSDSGVAAKISLGLEQSEVLSANVEGALAVPDIEAAETNLKELVAIVSDLEALQEKPNGTPDAEVPAEEPIDETIATSTEGTVGEDTNSASSSARTNFDIQSVLRF